MTAWIRSIHRWASVVFTALVVINTLGAIAQLQILWLNLLTFVPLFALWATGTVLYVRPWWRARSTG